MPCEGRRRGSFHLRRCAQGGSEEELGGQEVESAAAASHLRRRTHGGLEEGQGGRSCRRGGARGGGGATGERCHQGRARVGEEVHRAVAEDGARRKAERRER